MKELSIEEKAKAYDEAIKKAKDMLSYKEVRREDMEYLFPELKESEDERIRKALIVYLRSILSNKKYGDKFIESWIDWLEKQGKNNMGISESTKQKLEDNLNKALEKETPESFNEFLDEQKPAWSEEDERILNTVIHNLRYPGVNYYKKPIEEEVKWLKSLRPQNHWKPSDEQMDAINDAIDYLGGNTKIVRKHLMSLYDQLKKLKE